ncbi:MAG: GntR family transcriptional regulator [Rhodobiaceae bacterium]|nr:GntR family transcriptional regulator [Rhodobiaceae bacterium]
MYAICIHSCGLVEEPKERTELADSGKSPKARFYGDLRISILTLDLRPGADLDEARLAEKYGLSRTPLREVLRELAGEGYVELRENRGARVSDMSYTTLRDFFLAAPMIYAAILQLAARNRTERQIGELRLAQREFVSALRKGSAVDRTLANNRFHEITGEMAGNIYLLPSFRRLLIDHARIGMTFYRPANNEMAENLSLASDQHEEIIEAIAAGDDARSARLAEEHWNLSRGQIELFVTPAGLEASLGSAGRPQEKSA